LGDEQDKYGLHWVGYFDAGDSSRNKHTRLPAFLEGPSEDATNHSAYHSYAKQCGKGGTLNSEQPEVK